jgi:hypothetical protein
MNQILRVLVPSWKFFDATSFAPELYYRLQNNVGWGEWILAIPKIGKRSFKHLWVNSEESFGFASHALLEHLVDDLSEEKDSSVSLALVNQLVRFRINRSLTLAAKFQFKVAYVLNDQEPIYSSPEFETQEQA